MKTSFTVTILFYLANFINVRLCHNIIIRHNVDAITHFHRTPQNTELKDNIGTYVT